MYIVTAAECLPLTALIVNTLHDLCHGSRQNVGRTASNTGNTAQLENSASNLIERREPSSGDTVIFTIGIKVLDKDVDLGQLAMGATATDHSFDTGACEENRHGHCDKVCVNLHCYRKLLESRCVNIE
jgi:hypothetical protein